MATDVRNNEAQSRYEILVDGELAGFADYRLQGDVMVFPHTETSSTHRGQGLGAVLVEGALQDVRASGRKVVPLCWYVAEYLEQHPEHGDLVADR